jgi:cytoskeletal protein CcmA (bactofilin family)
MNAPNPKNASITLIGPEMRVDGRIDFAGVLRVHGEIAGDVASNQPGQGLLVVEDSGKIAGAVVAPHIVLKGKILGSVQSAGLVEIHRGGRVSGDVSYRQVDVRSGGVVDGKLSLAEGRPVDQMPAAGPNAPESIEATDDAPQGPWRRKLVWGAAAVAAIVVGVIWMRPSGHVIKPVGVDLSPPVTSPVPTLSTSSTSPTVALAPPPAPAQADPVPAPKAARAPEPVAPVVAAAAPAPTASAPAATPPAAAPVPPPDRGRVVTVQGTNPEKSASQFYVTTREDVVLQRKKRGDAGEGKAVEIARNRNTSLQIGTGEVFRVVQGRDVDIFFQGRRVSKPNIDNGDWLSFVPIAAGD